MAVEEDVHPPATSSEPPINGEPLGVTSTTTLPAQAFPPPMPFDSDSEPEDDEHAGMSPIMDLNDRPLTGRPTSTTSITKLFTPEELAMLPSNVLDRQRARTQARKSEKAAGGS